jgi:hypothetical protein
MRMSSGAINPHNINLMLRQVTFHRPSSGPGMLG